MTTTSKKAVVLLSGGLDSCVAAAIAVAQGYEIHPLSVNYGQRHSREQTSAARIAEHYGAKMKFLTVYGFGEMVADGTVLTSDKPLPANRSDEEMSNGKAPSYVPGRNTILLGLAQSYAETIGADVIFCGVNHVDYSGYVDCRPAFIAAWNDLAGVSTFRGIDGSPIWVEAPLIEMTKVDIVRKGLELGAPLNLSWSCYAGGVVPCNTCDSCQIRNAAFEACGMTDPAVA